MRCHCLDTHFGFVADSLVKLFYDESKKTVYIYIGNNTVTTTGNNKKTSRHKFLKKVTTIMICIYYIDFLFFIILFKSQ